jgi:hypothetical protein
LQQERVSVQAGQDLLRILIWHPCSHAAQEHSAGGQVVVNRRALPCPLQELTQLPQSCMQQELPKVCSTNQQAGSSRVNVKQSCMCPRTRQLCCYGIVLLCP